MWDGRVEERVDWKRKGIDIPFVVEPKQSDVCGDASPTDNAFVNK